MFRLLLLATLLPVFLFGSVQNIAAEKTKAQQRHRLYRFNTLKIAEMPPLLQMRQLRSDRTELEKLLGKWEITTDIAGIAFVDYVNLKSLIVSDGYDMIMGTTSLIGYDEGDTFVCTYRQVEGISENYTCLSLQEEAANSDDDLYNWYFFNLQSSGTIAGLYVMATMGDMDSDYANGYSYPMTGVKEGGSTSSSGSTEEILNSNLTTLKNTLLATKTYSVSGSFADYDFAGVDTAFDWTFTTPANDVYQLQGNMPTPTDVFGWKKVSVVPHTPVWYMSYLGDWDSDGSAKYDWILVGNGFDGVYKLEGVSATGNFAYSTPINIPYSVSSDKKTITFGTGSGDDPADPGLPGAAAKRAMEAQVSGNVTGFLAECDMSGYSESAKAYTREVFNTVRDKAQMSNFKYTHRVTGTDATDTYATVRSIVSFTVKTPDGTNAVEEGVLTFLKKVSGSWKVVRMAPDDLLNQELYERSASAAALKTRIGSAVDLQKLNDAIDEMLRKGHLKGDKLLLDTYAAGVGTLPVVGDGMAMAYEGLDTANDGWEAIQEFSGNGLTFVCFLKVAQMGAGIVQIVTEPIPGVDTAADVVGAALEQFTHNIELSRDLNALKKVIRDISEGTVALNPYLFIYTPYSFAYPGGFETEAMSPLPQHSYGSPVGTMRITKPEAFDELIPLRVVGEISFSTTSPAASLIRKLGGAERNGKLYFPVDLGYLVTSIVMQGDAIFDNANVYAVKTASTKLIGWSVTCRRGTQRLGVTLKNGETTPYVKVYNDLMNNVDELYLPQADNGALKMNVGESKSGVQVLGKGALIETRFWPDLTNRAECLDMAIDNTSVASLSRGATLSVKGLKNGDTTLDLLLIGSSELPSYTELQEQVLIEVGSGGDGCSMRYDASLDTGVVDHTYNIKLTDGYARCSYYETGELHGQQPFQNLDNPYTPHGWVLWYYKTGVVASETYYINGQENGLQKWYYESGLVQQETPFVNGDRNGTQKQYSQSGQLSATVPYVDDKINGIVHNYDYGYCTPYEDNVRVGDDYDC